MACGCLGHAAAACPAWLTARYMPPPGAIPPPLATVNGAVQALFEQPGLQNRIFCKVSHVYVRASSLTLWPTVAPVPKHIRFCRQSGP